MMDRLKRKYDTARQFMPAPQLYPLAGATIGIIAYGSVEAAVVEAQHQLDRDHGIKADFLRVRAIPFTDEVRGFVEKYDQHFIVEMNRDGQLRQLLTLEYPQHATRFLSVAYGDGLPASAKWVREGILAKYAKPAPRTAPPSVKSAVAGAGTLPKPKKAAVKAKPATKAAKAIRK